MKQLPILALALCAILTAGCMSPRAHFYLGQGADLATTYYALEVDGRFKEGNLILKSMNGVVAGKILYIGMVELLAYIMPDYANMFYGWGALTGYVPATYNTYMILEGQVK